MALTVSANRVGGTAENKRLPVNDRTLLGLSSTPSTAPAKTAQVQSDEAFFNSVRSQQAAAPAPMAASRPAVAPAQQQGRVLPNTVATQAAGGTTTDQAIAKAEALAAQGAFDMNNRAHALGVPNNIARDLQNKSVYTAAKQAAMRGETPDVRALLAFNQGGVGLHPAQQKELMGISKQKTLEIQQQQQQQEAARVEQARRAELAKQQQAAQQAAQEVEAARVKQEKARLAAAAAATAPLPANMDPKGRFDADIGTPSQPPLKKGGGGFDADIGVPSKPASNAANMASNPTSLSRGKAANMASNPTSLREPSTEEIMRESLGSTPTTLPSPPAGPTSSPFSPAEEERLDRLNQERIAGGGAVNPGGQPGVTGNGSGPPGGGGRFVTENELDTRFPVQNPEAPTPPRTFNETPKPTGFLPEDLARLQEIDANRSVQPTTEEQQSVLEQPLPAPSLEEQQSVLEQPLPEEQAPPRRELSDAFFNTFKGMGLSNDQIGVLNEIWGDGSMTTEQLFDFARQLRTEQAGPPPAEEPTGVPSRLLTGAMRNSLLGFGLDQDQVQALAEMWGDPSMTPDALFAAAERMKALGSQATQNVVDEVEQQETLGAEQPVEGGRFVPTTGAFPGSREMDVLFEEQLINMGIDGAPLEDLKQQFREGATFDEIIAAAEGLVQPDDNPFIPTTSDDIAAQQGATLGNEAVTPTPTTPEEMWNFFFDDEGLQDNLSGTIKGLLDKKFEESGFAEAFSGAKELAKLVEDAKAIDVSADPDEIANRVFDMVSTAFDEAEDGEKWDTFFEMMDVLSAQFEDVQQTTTLDVNRIQERIDEINEENRNALAGLAEGLKDATTASEAATTADTALRERLDAAMAEVVDNLGFDPEAERTARREQIDRDFQESAEALARQFGVDFSGATSPETFSGQAKRVFTQLHAERLRQYTGLEAELSQREFAARQESARILTSAIGTVGQLDLGENSLAEGARQFDVSTAEGKRQFNALVEERADQFAKTHSLDSARVQQAWANLTGQVATGATAISASSLGIGSIDLPADGDPLRAPQAGAVRAAYEAVTGQAISNNDLRAILRGEDVQVNTATTLQAQQLREEQRQYDLNLARRVEEFGQQFGLSKLQTEAAVREVNQRVLNDTRRLSNEIGQTWANITGRVGTETGLLTAADLGVTLPEGSDSLPFFSLKETPEAQALSDGFEGMMGRPASDAELADLLAGETLTVDGMPTLEARQVAATISNQNLERLAKYDAIAEEHQLNRDKFIQATDEADRIWNLTTLNVGEVVGIDGEDFRAIKHAYDNQLLKGRTPEAAMSTLREHMQRQGISDAQFLQASDLFDQQYGTQARQIAIQNGFDQATFESAQRQANLAEEQMETLWGSILEARGGEKRDRFESEGGLYGDPRAAEAAYSPFINSFFDVANNNGLTDTFQVAQFMGENIEDHPEAKRLITDFENIHNTNIHPTDYGAFLHQVRTEIDKADTAQAGYDAASKARYHLRAFQNDWLLSMDKDKIQSIFALINGGNISPERQSMSTSQQFGLGIGQILGTLLPAVV